MLRRFTTKATSGAVFAAPIRAAPIIGRGAAAATTRNPPFSAATTAVFASSFAVQAQRRTLVEKIDYLGKDVAQISKVRTKPQVEEVMPEIFIDHPDDVDDYVRPEKTFFEGLEDYWDSFLTFLSPVDRSVDGIMWMQSCSLSWGITFFLFGFMVRGMTLPLMIYTHRNSLRLAAVNKPLTDINNKLQVVSNDQSLSNADRKLMEQGHKRTRDALYKKYKCNQRVVYFQVINAPILASAFMAVRRLASYEESLETANWMWIKDMSMPDPTVILPVCCICLFLANFEMTQRALKGSSKTTTTMFTRWGARVAVLAFLYWGQAQPACMFVYWIGMSSMGLIQPVLLSNDKFRSYFDFPEKAVVINTSDKENWLVRKFGWILPAALRARFSAADADDSGTGGATATSSVTGGKTSYQNIREIQKMIVMDDILDEDEDGEQAQRDKKKAAKKKFRDTSRE